MRLTNIIQAVRFEPWLITPAAHATIADVVMRAASGQFKVEDDFISQIVNQRPAMTIEPNGIATIHIMGPLLSKSTPIERTCGITDYAQIQGEIMEAKAKGATEINFMIDSPGGMVLGCQETAAMIRECGMRTYAYVDGQCCSAAYWLASQTRLIMATPSSVVGSIGVIMPWVDQDGAWEKAGIRWNPVTNDGADLKGMGGGPSLSPEQRAFLTESANATAAEFWQQVTDMRDMPEEVKRAGFYSGGRALALNLIDEII